MEFEIFDPASVADWHRWLQKHHLKKRGIWLVYHRRESSLPTISYDESLDQALTFGWIDSVIRKIDDKSYARKFTPRRPRSIWSKLNIDRVNRLQREGRMTRWGLEAFEKQTGEVSMLEQVNAEGAPVPEDFVAGLKRNSLAWSNFNKMAPSHRKRYLIWIAGAKRPETRRKRIEEAVTLVSQNVKDLLK